MNKLKIFIVLVIITVTLGGYYWTINKPNDSQSPIKIGAVISLTGYASTYGEQAQKAMLLAAEEINEKGGINGRKVEIVIEDDQTDAKQAVSAFQKLVSVNKVDGVIGSIWDFTTQPLLPLSNESGIVLITPTNFRIEKAFELTGNSFAMMPDFKKVIVPIETYIEKEDVKNLAVVRFSGPFGEEISSVLKDIMRRRGQKIMDEKYVDFENNDFRTVILKLKQSKADTVFLDMTDADMNNFLKQARNFNFYPKIISHVVAMDLLSNPNTEKSLAENIVFLNWEAQPEEFSKIFKARYGISPTKSADKSYDAVYALANAIAKSKNKNEIRENLEKSSFQNINGTFHFSNNHVIENIPIEIDVIKNGQIIRY